MHLSDQAKGILLTSIGVLAVVPDSIFVRLIEVDILTLIQVRAGFAAVVILAFVVLTERQNTLATFRGLGRFGMIYAFFMAIATLFFLSAIRHTSVANALFIVSTSPVMAALISWLVLGERFSARMVWTTVFALAGIAVIAYGSGEVAEAHWQGDLLALGAALSLAAAFTAARAGRSVSMVPAASLAYFGTVILVWPFTDLTQLSRIDWIYLAIFGGIFIPIGTSFMALGPRYITSAEVSLLLLLEAVLAPLLVWWMFGEDPGRYALIGGALVIGTLLVSNLVALRK